MIKNVNRVHILFASVKIYKIGDVSLRLVIQKAPMHVLEAFCIYKSLIYIPICLLMNS